MMIPQAPCSFILFPVPGAYQRPPPKMTRPSQAKSLRCPICTNVAEDVYAKARADDVSDAQWGQLEVWSTLHEALSTFSSGADLAEHMLLHGWAPRGGWSR